MAISREDVVNCYRYILGREPESEEAIQYHMNRAENLMTLSYLFLRSDEFAKIIETMEWEDFVRSMGLVKEFQRKDIPYLSVEVDQGIFYVFDSGDVTIGQWMRAHEKNFSWDLIEAFFRLTDQYYGKKKRCGYFFDIGGNIGTTSIYVKKVCNPLLKVVAFEPMQKNFDLFHVNCRLNHIDDIEVVHVGLGAVQETKDFFYRRNNPGASGIMMQGKAGLENVPQIQENLLDSSVESVKIMPLDDYCRSESLSASNVDYLWIDVEGFESSVIEGAMGILSENRIPLMQEFNPKHYADWEGYVSRMSGIYDGFIDMNEYLEDHSGIYEIRELHQHRESVDRWQYPQSNLFFF